MLRNNQNQLKGYLFWAVILGLIALASFIVLPFMSAILSAYLLAYMARPLFLKLIPRFGQNLAGVICVFVAIILVIVPAGFVVIQIVNESGDFMSKQNITHYIGLVADHPLLKGFNLNSATLQTQFNQIVADTTISTLSSLPAIAVGLFITLIGMYYILCSWVILSDQLKKHIPFKNKERIVRELDKTAKAILYVTLAMAVMEFVISYIGFTISGVEASLIMAAVIFVFAFIPSIGPILVWAPLTIYYIANQQYQIAAGVIITGLILTVVIEQILYAKWIGDRTRIHPFVMVLGVIGGITVFGIFGFIFGPLILASAMGVVKGAMEQDELSTGPVAQQLSNNV
ncbi:MAG TPA: AI-2E family transporter [archaeon]|nr:AI-2E family transporter [archaeon]